MLANEPELDIEEQEYINGYSILRNQSGSDPISLHDVFAYCLIENITDMEAFMIVITAADTEYLKAASEYREREMHKAKAKSKTRRRR